MKMVQDCIFHARKTVYFESIVWLIKISQDRIFSARKSSIFIRRTVYFSVLKIIYFCRPYIFRSRAVYNKSQDRLFLARTEYFTDDLYFICKPVQKSFNVNLCRILYEILKKKLTGNFQRGACKGKIVEFRKKFCTIVFVIPWSYIYVRISPIGIKKF